MADSHDIRTIEIQEFQWQGRTVRLMAGPMRGNTAVRHRLLSRDFQPFQPFQPDTQQESIEENYARRRKERINDA